jgi:tellurite resistance protein TehA-like permease
VEEEPKEQSTQKLRYPVLEIISFIFQILAVLVIVGALAVVIIIFVRAEEFDTSVASAMGIIFVIGTIGSAILWALSEIINVFTHIEENTRRTSELLQMKMKIMDEN